MKSMVCHKWYSGLAFIAVMLLGVSTAFAATDEMAGQEAMDADDVAQEDEDAYEKMLQLSAEGEQLYEAGNFSEAAEIYQAAWDAYPQPILLKNQMITRYLIDQCETAVELGQQFLDTGEDSAQDREDVEAVFGECSLELAEAAMDDEEWLEAEDWLDFGEPYLFEDQLRADADELRAELDEQIAGDDSIEHIDDPGMSSRELAGWSSVGVGAATLLSAGIWHWSWERQVAEDPAAVEERYSTVSWAIPTTYAIGGTAAAVGAGLLLWPALTGGDDSRAMIHPQLSHDRAGAVFSVTF